jgi:hypothetical protein
MSGLHHSQTNYPHQLLSEASPRQRLIGLHQTGGLISAIVNWTT